MTEGDFITQTDLQQAWQHTLSFYNNLIENGHKLRPIRFLVRHIMEKGDSINYYPGTSLYTLLISIPTNNKIDFTKTLRIKVDELAQKIMFRYSDYSGMSRLADDYKKAIKWTTTCELSEINDTFDYFITQFEEWKILSNGK